MKRTNSDRSVLILLLCLICGCAGCVWEHEDRAKVDLGVDARPAPFSGSPAYRDTIGELSYYSGLGPLPVRGYGLVAGLGKNGSRDCPKSIYRRLIQALYKLRRPENRVDAEAPVTPEELFDDLDTAVAVVHAQVPAAAVAGARFDVSVLALPGTQTKSLRNGRLYVTDLEVFRSVTPGASISGKVLARAAGPIFLNPFVDEDSATKSNPLAGIVLGGGVIVKDRDVRLTLIQPSYAWARKIQERINAQFPGGQRVASATSPSTVQLRIPPEYRDDQAHFLGLVRALYLSREPNFEAVRARMLGEEIVRPTAPHARIAFCFEGLGQKALPVLGELYTHPEDYVSFHATAAGLRLGDHVAGDVMAVHAENPQSEYRFRAIRALGQAKGMAAPGMALRRLLEDNDPRVQIAAYEALLERQDPTIHSTPVAGENFVLDRIPVTGSGIVYAKRSGQRRIALFGQGLWCSPPVFYRSPDGSLTITAQADGTELTVMRRIPATGSVSPPIPASFDLSALIRLLGSEAEVDLDGRVTGLGLDYGAVVGALNHLCVRGFVNAEFILEQPNVAELFGPRPASGRPESEP